MGRPQSMIRCIAIRWSTHGYHQCQVSARAGSDPPLCGTHLRRMERDGEVRTVRGSITRGKPGEQAA